MASSQPSRARRAAQGCAAAAVPVTGRYAAQGAQVRAGLELWAARTGTRLLIEDDRSDPDEAARLHAELVEGGCRFVLGPYGSDSVRAVATADPGGVVWNHGAAADDVQRLSGVVSVASPASGYLVALARAVATLAPGARIAVATAGGRFARFAREGLEREQRALDIELVATFSLGDAPAAIAATGADAFLACGPVAPEIELLRALAELAPGALRGGVSPGLADFPALLEGDPEGLIAPAQWHPETGGSPEMGPSSAEVVAEARARAPVGLDYVGAQAYAAALIADRCLELSADDPPAAARRLRTTTFFGDFELDPATGLQRGHRLTVVRWSGGSQELRLAAA